MVPIAMAALGIAYCVWTAAVREQGGPGAVWRAEVRRWQVAPIKRAAAVLVGVVGGFGALLLGESWAGVLFIAAGALALWIRVKERA